MKKWKYASFIFALTVAASVGAQSVSCRTDSLGTTRCSNGTNYRTDSLGTTRDNHGNSWRTDSLGTTRSSDGTTYPPASELLSPP